MFLGSPYCWGGCCPQDKQGKYAITSFDSSGLVFLCHKACGIIIPRNAHHQYLYSSEVKPSNLQPGDLVFFMYPKSNYTQVAHVAVYAGDGMLIESVGNDDTQKNVLMIKDTDLLGTSLATLKNYETVNEKLIWCGTFVNN